MRNIKWGRWRKAGGNNFNANDANSAKDANVLRFMGYEFSYEYLEPPMDADER